MIHRDEQPEWSVRIGGPLVVTGIELIQSVQWQFCQFCGHCQIGPYFVCKDGPVFDLPRVKPFLTVREM